jgi:pantoate--beta-alanine ligase
MTVTTVGPAPVVSPTIGAPTVPVRVVDSVAGLSSVLDAARASGRTVGLVPTMGALHDGHRALIVRAALECDVVAVSIFVNPTQFGDPADLANYPRSLSSDLSLVAAAGGAIVFAPSVDEMYPHRPDGNRTAVSLRGLADRWEGLSRPGHFDGVATVVVKLLAMAGRCRAYFGEKDFQQLAVVRRVASDLSLPVEVVGCETVRDTDGLALSSRNARLSPELRHAALALPRALRTGACLIRDGEERPQTVEEAMAKVVAAEPDIVLDYAAVAQAEDLEPARTCRPVPPVRLLIAATVGPVRLIDNLDPHRGL